MVINLDPVMEQNLIKLCQHIDTTPERFAEDAINRAMAVYFSPKEEINMRPGYYVYSLPNDKSSIEKIPCVILKDTTVFGKPYVSVISRGSLVKVPKECVIEENGTD